MELDLTEASKTNPYVQFSVFSNDLLSLICLNEDPRMDQLGTGHYLSPGGGGGGFWGGSLDF